MPETNSLTGGELLVRSLQNLGVTTCFGVPGESYLAVLDALYDASINFTLCRHESAASFAASAWGKLTGTPGICFVTRGPGATNGSIGVHSAMQDSSPMILFVGQVAVGDKAREAFQEIDYKAMFGTVAKWAIEIDDASRVSEIVARAWHIALSGRPGPVVIALPEDMLIQLTDAPAVQPMSVPEPATDMQALAEAGKMLAEAKQPLILVGGSYWQDSAKSALQDFAERNHIPVSAVFRYHDVFDNTHPCYIGDAGVGMAAGVERRLKEADVILAINARFGEATTKAWTLFDVPYPAQKIIHIHPCDRELGKIYQPALSLHAGPNQLAHALASLEIDNQHIEAKQKWLSDARSDYESSLRPRAQNSPVDMSAVMGWLQTHLDEDVIITNGAGNFALWPNKVFSYGAKQRLLAPQSGAMGYGLPAAIAASLAHPGRQVVCFAGDGDIQMGIAELGTAKQAGAKIIIIVLNNGSYGTIRMHQERDYPGRISGTSLENPDFVAVANAYGLAGKKVSTTTEFAAAFEAVNNSETGGVIELDISVEAITPARSLSEISGKA